ncbi:hypothetical protein [Oenococcus sicerae]|uniref:hypothetical protein n=1 Tax=Oenococcus sicerae TaxID=2203724 RepID=UPI0039E9ECB6
MKLEDKIIKLLAEHTAYSIQQATGVSQVTLGNINRGEAKIENLSLKNAQTLADYYDLTLIADLQANIGQQRYTELITFLTSNFKEIIDSQNYLSKSDEGNLSDKIMAEILDDLFHTNIIDPLFIIKCSEIITKF